MKMDQDILWAISAEDVLLSRVEDFLINADEPELQAKLNKLQQDTGLALAQDLTGTAMEPYQQPNDECAGPKLIASFEPVTAERLRLLVDIHHALEAHGAEMYQDYSKFVFQLQAKTAPASMPSAGPAPIL